MKISQITFDAHDPAAIARFWREALGWRGDDEDPIVDDVEETAVVSPDAGSTLLFIRVPESKSVKNRVHLDIAPTDSTRDAEVTRLQALGASIYDDQRRPDGRGWVVMRDPEGNEFCVERSAAEKTR